MQPLNVESFAYQMDLPGRLNAVAAILGRTETGVYRLTPIAPESLEVQIATARGLYFIGVIGFVGGVPTAALDYPLDTPTIQRLRADFVARFVRTLAAPESADANTGANTDRRAYLPGGAVPFLERLYQLPDERHTV